MKQTSIIVRIDDDVKKRLEKKAEKDGLKTSKVIRDLINDYISDNKDLTYIIDKDKKVVKTFIELNNVCSSIEDNHIRNEALRLLGVLQCLY